MTTHLHSKYCKENAYYASSILKGNLLYNKANLNVKLGITQNDKRLTDDIHSFADSITDLFNHTFKVNFIIFN